MTERASVEILVTTELKKALSDLKGMHSALKDIEGAAKSMGNVLKTGLALVGLDIGIRGITGIIAATAEWDRTAEQLTAQLNGNAVMATTWMGIAKLAGVETITLQRSFAHLSVEVQNNSATLREMGIATVDQNGHFLSMGQIVNQVADYFHKHAGATNEGALAQQLFSRAGVELIPILEQGSAGIQQLSDQLRRYGYVVEAEALQRNSRFSASLREGVIAVEGLGMSLVHAAGPGLAVLGRGLASIAEQIMPEFIAAVENAASFIVGFFEGLTGKTFEISATAAKMAELQTATSGFGDASDKAAGGGNRFADAERKVREQAKAATDAIQAQIKALEEQTSVENFQDTQRKLHQKLIDDNKKVDQDYSNYQNLILHGYEAAAMDQLTNLQSAQQTAADDATEIDKGAKQEQRRTLIDQLREQEKEINDSADKQIAAMQRAATGMSGAIAGAMASVPGMADKAGKALGLNLNTAAEKAGRDMANALKSGDWDGVGSAIGGGIAHAMGYALSHIKWADLFKAVIFGGHPPTNPKDWLGWLMGISKGATNFLAGTDVDTLLGIKPLFNPTSLLANPSGPPGTVGFHPLASGLDFVPYDGYLASLHRGEKVVPAKENGRAMVNNFYITNESPERTAQLVADTVGKLMAA